MKSPIFRKLKRQGRVAAVPTAIATACGLVSGLAETWAAPTAAEPAIAGVRECVDMWLPLVLAMLAMLWQLHTLAKDWRREAEGLFQLFNGTWTRAKVYIHPTGAQTHARRAPHSTGHAIHLLC